jgi:hypothetical protein
MLPLLFCRVILLQHPRCSSDSLRRSSGRRQGNNYFNSGRANGLSFYESAALTAFGTWEYFGETNKPSLNDVINTTLGGIALGEMFHRTAWLIRDTHATGRRRLWREIGATALDPVTGYNRFRTGDAKRVTEKPPDMVPASLTGFTSAGVLWRGSKTRAIDATGQPFLELDALLEIPQVAPAGRPTTPSPCAFDWAAAPLSAKPGCAGGCWGSPWAVERCSSP